MGITRITWKRRGFEDKGGALQHFSFTHEKRATESPRATQQSPYLAAARISKRKEKKDRNHGYPQTRKGDQRGKGRNTVSPFRARKSRALLQLSDREFEDRDPHARRAGGTRNSFMLRIIYLFFPMMLESWHLKSERCEVRGVKSGEEGRQVFADAMQDAAVIPRV